MTEASDASSEEPDSIEDALRAALADHRAGRHVEAGRLYRRILSIEPCVPDAQHLLGLIAFSAGATGLAATLIERAIALDGSAALYHFNLGNAFRSGGRSEDAALSYQRTLDLQPSHEVAARNLGVALVQLASLPDAVRRFLRLWGTQDDAVYHPIDALRRAQSGPGYLLIRGWGCGFWGEVNHVAVQLALADIMGRVPIVYWGTEFHYRPSGSENAWDAYFEPVSAAKRPDLEGGNQTYFPGNWTSANLWTSEVQPMRQAILANPHGRVALAGLNRMESIVVADGYVEMSDVLRWAAPSHPLSGRNAASMYRAVFDKKIHPRTALKNKINKISNRYFLKENSVMAIHFRAQNSIKTMESLELTPLSPEDYFPHIEHFLSSHINGRIFVITDVETAIDAFRNRFGTRMIVLPRQRIADGGQFDVGLDHTRDLGRLAIEVLEDAYLAAACDHFLGDGASGVSCAVVALKDWPTGHARLLRRNVFTDRSGATTL